MQLETFLDKITALVDDKDGPISRYSLKIPQKPGMWSDSLEYLDKDAAITAEVCVEGEEIATEGASGGDCYGGHAESWSSHQDNFPIDKALEPILEAIAPHITFLQYRAVVRDLDIKRGSRGSGGDYYGNYTKYEFSYVSLGEIYRVLNEKGLLPE